VNNFESRGNRPRSSYSCAARRRREDLTCWQIRCFGYLFFPVCCWGRMRNLASRSISRSILKSEPKTVSPAPRSRAGCWIRRGLQEVAIESTPGVLSDHYDPGSKTLRLSQEVYFAPSVSAAGIAAHEAGHALQDAVDYFPLEARTYIVPLVQLASQIAPWLFIAGVLLQLTSLAWVGVVLFGSSSLFALITLPVEFNASARAQKSLVDHGIIRGGEQIAGVEKVLGAAAWTYVAAAVSAIGSWIFYVFVLLSQVRSTHR